MAFIKRSFILAAVVIGVGLPAHANLLINGSFESGNFAPNAQDTMALAVGATDMTGWTVVNNPLAWIGSANPFGLSASDGGRFLDLSGYDDSAPYGGVALSQTISTTIGGQYQLTFDIGTDSDYDGNGVTPISVQVSAGVNPPQTFTTTPPFGNNQWISYTYNFTATTANTSLSLIGQASTSISYIGLDNANLILVPEPSTLTLLAAPGLLVFAMWRRRRKA